MSRRARLTPADVGLDAGGRRRTPGLRREEVAARAGISPDYYTRLEQGRPRVPTPGVLDALAHALLLGDAERAYLHTIAVPRRPRLAGAPEPLTPAARAMLDALTGTPAFVIGPRFDLLAWNRLGSALMAGLAERPPHQRNLLWQVFCCPHGAATPANREPDDSIGAQLVAALRAEHAGRPADPGLGRLVARLSAASPDFAALWDMHRAGGPGEGELRVAHPLLATDTLPFTLLTLPTPGHRLFVCLPPPGTPAPFDALAASAT
ncbi:helix-turn-helix domain-containing protein [Streptomyces capoamus]|uniref:helix-turn-helix domain-containing protein n=1 Tax=Streptomyces capoamus TaxID=68183 RepID=UPI0027954FF2|nr:helix-turn-helix transcriptional regulator [Streptomyces capoamus]